MPFVPDPSYSDSAHPAFAQLKQSTEYIDPTNPNRKRITDYVYENNFVEGLVINMLHAISIFLVGAFFWVLVLNKYPFNQKGFEVLDPLRKNYQTYLKIGGTILILYSMLLFIEF